MNEQMSLATYTMQLGKRLVKDLIKFSKQILLLYQWYLWSIQNLFQKCYWIKEKQLRILFPLVRILYNLAEKAIETSWRFQLIWQYLEVVISVLMSKAKNSAKFSRKILPKAEALCKMV